MTLTLAPELQEILVPGVLGFDGVRVATHDSAMDASIAETGARLRAGVEATDVVAAVRAMYRRVGIDPTKTRPSSEALLRRIRKGGALPRVNSAVDVCNWCSVETLLPFGLYDRDRIEGDVALRLGRDGEEYEGIRKDVVHVGGRMTLADVRGPFGNPTSDSARTMVTVATTRLLLVVFGPASLGRGAVDRALDLTSGRMVRHTGGREVLRLPGAASGSPQARA